MKQPTQINIDIPQGYEIDKDNSTFECIKFKKIEKQLPNSWSEFCNQTDLKYPYTFSNKIGVPDTYIALRKLELLRDCYNDGWVADWSDNSGNFLLFYHNNKIVKSEGANSNTLLNFKTAELRDLFLKNFRDIIEIAKPLL